MQATDVDDGHTFSPALREQQKEVAELHARLPVLAAEGVAEFDRLYAEGFGCTTPEEARERFVAAYVLARELNHRRGEADALNMAAITYRELGDVRGAAELFEGSRALLARLGDAPGEAAALGSIGAARAALGELDAAQSAHEEGLAIARRLRDGRLQLGALTQLGALQLRRGQMRPAHVSLCEALALSAALGDAVAEAGVLQRLAATFAALGGPDAEAEAPGARARVRIAVEPAPEVVAPPDPAAAEAAGADGGAAAALGCLRRAEALAAEADVAPLRLQILRQTRAQLVQMGQSDEARRCEATIDEVRAALEAPEREGARESG